MDYQLAKTLYLPLFQISLNENVRSKYLRAFFFTDPKPTVHVTPRISDLDEGDNEEITCTGNSPNITWRDPRNNLVQTSPM